MRAGKSDSSLAHLGGSGSGTCLILTAREHHHVLTDVGGGLVELGRDHHRRNGVTSDDDIFNFRTE